MLGRNLYPEDECDAARNDENALFLLLRSGVILRELMVVLAPNEANPTPIARSYTKLLAPWKERENISIFLNDCRMLGMADSSMFCTDDLYEGSNMVQVLFGLQYIQCWFNPNSLLSTRSNVSSPRSTKLGSLSDTDFLAMFQNQMLIEDDVL
ncbi:hypothetical protein ACHHYP_01431 [Achlya hypogyna]|uniref:Calponin-homology (CH) domain-containing protein n=1 Tax=Achlya hypogyna TaxID=1202772 RepID=A0A1V9Z8M7_ACHHY|nr:hypothetical protein ACHHYP_01431 [Achlya hypogyna]